MRALLLAVVALAALAAIPPAHASGPTLPCQNGIAGTDCGVGALNCTLAAGYRTGSQQYEYARAYCGPELWAPCELAYADTDGNVRTCLVG